MTDLITNDLLLQHVLNSVLDIASRKTSEGEAIETMNLVLNDMHTHYSFLKHIQIMDARFTEDNRSVMVNQTIENIDREELGLALEMLISRMHRSLGKKAGHFFMKELKKRVGEDYFYTMKDLGVDLSVMQLENEVLK